MADVFYPDRRALFIGKDDIIVVRRLQYLVIGGNGEALLAAVDCAFGRIGGDVAQHQAHVFQSQFPGRQLLRIELHAHGRLLLTADKHESDARDLRKLLRENVFRVVVRLNQRRGIRCYREDEDRGIGGIIFAVIGRHSQICWQPPPGRSDRRLHILCRRVDVPVQLELDVDLGVAECVDRRELDDTRDLAELLFERVRNRCSHGLGAGARKLRRNLDRREVDLR